VDEGNASLRAAVEETPEEGRLDIQRVKMLTSPEITARLMRQDNVTFKTTHALIVNTNHEPRVESTDHGTWRRLPLVKYPYTYLKPGQPKRLPTHRSGDRGCGTG
jgi:putative DNA primase/helicase